MPSSLFFPLDNIQPSRLIDQYSGWIYFTLVLVFFVSIAGIALRRHFDKPYVKPLIISVGLMLTFGAFRFRDQMTNTLTTFRGEDAPIPFEVQDLPEHLEVIAEEKVGQFVQWLNIRIRTIVSDGKLRRIVAPDDEPSLVEWLTDYIGDDGADNGPIAIIDLSLVPSDVLQIVIAAAARIVFEAAQRYRKINENELPTVLVLEEAHTFIHRATGDDTDSTNAAVMCRRTFERIAREGRKFGVGLVLSSQRPSELSPTVLAQCNTFILHRIVNDRDQQLVSRLVPDNLAGLLGQLPSLPTRRAILLGWVVPVPVLVEIKALPRKHCPTSEDPSFWEVWTGQEKRPIDWEKIAKDWTSS